ncbi:hypothetical protein JCM12296A_55950 [Desulfosarcina cetonica]
MKKSFYFIAFFLVNLCFAIPGFSGNYSDNPIIDEAYKKIDLAIKADTEKCIKKENKMSAKMQCGDDILEKYRGEGKIRGTDEYCKKNYSSLNRDKLTELWNNLKAQEKKARVLISGQAVPGEVTASMFKNEVMWVEDRLSSMRKANIKSLGKKLFGN